jgi:4-diphosphocytidyl-2-C-methyl-D-erythritol kinase
MSVKRILSVKAPGKVNLALMVGGTRSSDGLHRLVSLIQPVSLADELTLELAPNDIDRDTVVCPGVSGSNLAAQALRYYREESGWDGPPVRLTINKKIPVAAGMGGGSADAAAALRLIAQAANNPNDPLLAQIAPKLGADVSAALVPRRVLITGAGEEVKPSFESYWKNQPQTQIDTPKIRATNCGFLILTNNSELKTPEVYSRFDQFNQSRGIEELTEIAGYLGDFINSTDLPPGEFITNDLQKAALSLFPEIEGALGLLRQVKPDHELVSGSGPTVFGIFSGNNGYERALAAAELLKPNPQSKSSQHQPWNIITARPITAAFAEIADDSRATTVVIHS